jgi:hypothetical protein
MADGTTMGPVAYLVVEFPPSTPTGNGLSALVDLVDGGVIRVLDLMFVRKDEDGVTRMAAIADFDGDGALDLAVFEGASSDLLDESDVAKAGDVLQNGASAALLLYENTWAIPFVDALRDGGAQLIAAGFVAQDELVDSLG